jgi:hypothetical protein
MTLKDFILNGNPDACDAGKFKLAKSDYYDGIKAWEKDQI